MHRLSVYAASLALLALVACSDASSYSPTAPSGPPVANNNGRFSGNIMDADVYRSCLANAQAAIVAGPGAGTVYPQDTNYCSDPGGGFVITGLPVGAVITLRISATGYTSEDRDFLIIESPDTIDLTLKRAS